MHQKYSVKQQGAFVTQLSNRQRITYNVYKIFTEFAGFFFTFLMAGNFRSQRAFR